jgi:YesN/AraC family two-component response regulator
MEGKDAIVCVDDEVIILLSLRQELNRHFKGRFRVETALCAEEALELVDTLYAEGLRVILILTDWLMPGIKGDEMILIVKRRYPDIRCILISGHVDEAALARTGAAPLLDAFIRKPWHGSRLIESIRKCVDEAGPSG